MSKKLSIFMVIFMVLAFLAGCTSDSQVEGDMQERTFSLRTNYNEYTNDELSVLLFDEILSRFNSDIWDFMVLEPDYQVQGSTFIQVGAPQEIVDFQLVLYIGFGDEETGFTMYRLYTADKNLVLQYFVDYWRGQQIPDISLWEDASYYFP